MEEKQDEVQRVGKKMDYVLVQMKETTQRIRSNDIIALVLLTGIIALWIVQGLNKIDLPEVILGATIAGWTLIIQYYFRKARSEKEGK